jgi:hypothetical protein
MSLFFSLRERDVYILPASGLDYIELENFHTGSEESVDRIDDVHNDEETEDYSDEDRPRKNNESIGDFLSVGDATEKL